MNAPPVSVIIPAWNAGQFLAEAIATVRRQIWPITEILVVDDGSTDDTAAVARAAGAGVRLVCQKNLGPAAARNRGLAETQGEFVTFLDADDLYEEEKIAREMEALLADPSAEIAVSFMQLFATAPDGARQLIQAPQFIFGFACGTYRRRVFEGPDGKIDESLRRGEDTDWFLRCCERGVPVKMIPRPGLLYRRHPGSITWGKNVQEKGLLQILKRSLDRRRADGSGQHAPAAVAWAQLFHGTAPPP